MKKFLLILCSIFLLTGCSDKTTEISISDITSELQAESQTESETEKVTETTDSNIFEKKTYREVLEYIYCYCKVLQYDVSNNEFAVYDVDNDGRDELIVRVIEAGVADQLASIYDRNSDGNIVLQFSSYPSMEFYENSAIKVYSAHNQTHSFKVHPFTEYEYDKETDSYNKIGIVYGLDKDIVDMVNQEKEEVGMTDFLDYPAEYDTSNSGTVYYIRPDWDRGAEIPIDVTEFNERYEQFTEGAEIIDIPFMKLTEENIQTVSQ